MELDPINILRLRQNVRHFADDPFKRIFAKETVRISIKISLKFGCKGQIKNITALVGTKSLSEPIVVGLSTNIWIARLQWVNCLHLDWNEVNGVMLKYHLFISKLFEMMPSCNFASQTSASYLYICRYDSSTPYHGHNTTRLIAGVEFKEQISNFTPNIIMDVISYPCWD